MHFRPPLTSSRNILQTASTEREPRRGSQRSAQLSLMLTWYSEETSGWQSYPIGVCRACKETSRRSTACAIPSTKKPAIFMDFSATAKTKKHVHSKQHLVPDIMNTRRLHLHLAPGSTSSYKLLPAFSSPSRCFVRAADICPP